MRQQWWRLLIARLIVSLALASVGEPTSAASLPGVSPSGTKDPRDTPVLTRLELPQGPVAPNHDAARSKLRGYVTRDVARSARHLDHGVLAVAIGLGTPHIYRLELALGLLDHLTLGVTAHWLPSQRVPNWTPRAALAFFRGRFIEVGATYHQVLYPPTADDGDPTTFEFQRRAHYALAHVSLSQAWFTGGVDLGWARGREVLPILTTDDVAANRFYAVRDRFAGGIHLRFGTRRVGVIAQVTFPYTAAELVLDLRFGLFELRRRGGWRQL